MKSKNLILILFPLFFAFNSCEKDDDTTTPPIIVCDVRGTYSGMNTASTGATSTIAYKLQDNNFAVGSLTPTSAAITFGGYRNTCDSVVLSVYYTSNSSYYLLQGKLTANTIAGTFKNLTTPSDFGTFTMSK